MIGIISFVTIFVLRCTSGTRSEPTTEKYTYNSSDLSYLSNGIQFPVAESEIEVSLRDSKENISQIQWFSGLYDHHKWRSQLDKLETPKCLQDMSVYLKELYNGTSWATKMYDASGRYSAQFLFGNDYWLGSKNLCEELTNLDTNDGVPPFDVQFYVAKIRININEHITPVTRQLNVGECLPKSCGINGVKNILAQESNHGATVNIVGIRKVPGDYSLFSDFKFHLVGGSGLVIVIIIALASLVDLWVSSSRKEKADDVENENNNSNNTNNNNTNNTFEATMKKENKRIINKINAIFLKILLSFSAIQNGRKILSVDKMSIESIKCIHGLRFFSISWIILVHTYLEVFAIADNKNLRTLTERDFAYQTISNATFSVDTFFFISGLLLTLTYFRSRTKKAKFKKAESAYIILWKSLLEFLYMVMYRVFRLTPPYMFVLGVNEIIMRYLHSNSVFSPAIIDNISCDKYWWRNALYINNFYPQSEFCMLWSWYMANDTQFYIIATVLLLIAIRGPKHLKFVAVSIGVLLLTSWLTTFLIAMKWQYVARVEQPFALFDQLYDKPWLRIGPYLMGMLAGYLLFRSDCKISLSPVLVALGWTSSLSCLGFLVYGLGRKGLVVPASAFYAALGHTAWGISLAWITLACSAGYGGPVNLLLSCKLFLPLSRLTYCAYLIHPVLMCLISFHLDGSLHLHNSMAIVIFCGNVVLSFISAFAISIVFEAPVVNLLKLVFM